VAWILTSAIRRVGNGWRRMERADSSSTARENESKREGTLQNLRRTAPVLLRSGVLWMPVVAAVGVLLTVLVFYPGFMSPDSVSQLAQGRAGVFGDWHPPVMSWIWGQMDRLLPGPVGMLLFHSLLYWTGLALWMALLAPQWPLLVQCLATLLVGLSPPLFALVGTVWKDVGMAAAFLLGSALLLHAERRRSVLPLVLGLAAIWYGFAVRHNAVVAALPLIAYAARTLCGLPFLLKSAIGRHTRIATGLVTLILMGLTAFTTTAVTRQMTRGETNFPIQQVLVHDLTAISIETNTVSLPSYLLSQPLNVSDLKRIYKPGDVVPLFCCDASTPRLTLTTDPKSISDLQQKWMETMVTQPGLYLSHRIETFAVQTSMWGDVAYPYHYGISANGLGLSYRERAFTKEIFAWLDTQRNGLFFRGWVYIAILVAIVAYWISKGKRSLPAALGPIAVATSGLLYGVSYLVSGTSSDFRMYYWPAIAALLCSVLLVSSMRTRT
jgi:hypothetical protein